VKNTARRIVLKGTLLSVAGLLAAAGLLRMANAQGMDLQQRLAEVKESNAQNKRMLASYTWVEQDTISLKGDVKKVLHYQVRLGPDLTPQKTSLDPPPAPPSGGRLKQRAVANKKAEYEDYADQMKALAEQYVPPAGELLQKAFASGNIMMGPTAGAPNLIQMVIKNYLKPQDSMTIIFDRTQKQVQQLQIASYLSDPKDAVTVTVQFSRLPDGTNHVSNMVLNGSGKQLNIAIANSNYQHV
jgi:hypothetical protein